MQTNCENHWLISNASNEVERINRNSIAKFGLDNPVSEKVKSIRDNLIELAELVNEFEMDAPQ